MPKARSFALALAGVALALACTKKDPPPAAPDAASEPPVTIGDGGGSVVPPPPGFVPDELDAGPDADAGEPFGKEADWSKGAVPGTKITYKYPGEIFLMDEDKTSVLLTSSIAVDPVQDDSGVAVPQYLFRIKIGAVALSLADAAKAEKAPMFPDGKREAFVEADGLAKKLVVAQRAAYMQRLIAHGFNTTVVLAELGPKRTLVARVETVGEELRGRVAATNWHPERWQLALVDKVLATLTDPTAPPLPKPKDAGK